MLNKTQSQSSVTGSPYSLQQSSAPKFEFKFKDEPKPKTDFFGEKGILAGGVAAAQGIGSLVNVGLNYSIADKANRRAKEQLALQKEQMANENARYNELRAEQKASQASSASSAGKFSTQNINPPSALNPRPSTPNQANNAEPAQEKQLPQERE